MRLVFVHGINNESSTVDEIRDHWHEALKQGWKDLGGMPTKKYSVEAAYYADILAEASGDKKPAIEMGGPGDPATGLAIEFLLAYSKEAGITDADITAEAAAQGVPLEAVEEGLPHEGWVIAFAKVLEAVLPTKGKYVARLFLRQAAIYIGDPVLAAKITAKVNEQIFAGKSDPTIVIGHSLGSVVSYRILADKEFSKRAIPLYVTVGSPLSVDIFKPILPTRGSLPKPPIERWINGRNTEDFVTMGKSITKKSIGFDGVEDVTDIIDNQDNRHDIGAYLRSPKIAEAIKAAIDK
ncbi:hypothetical protein G6L16_023415 [Agrobacterium tumefaciens]|uniref:hypothetical protein n=1 Tax=Agrobacterium tumefaciens TaxID=358 RepID=UPI001571CBB7|nr:hypothetical protein [Agrobacterium tumefaciens]NSZ66978.1 hypothetical protein [Agrobacterium tumefaciens]NTA73351.1 hypothetical protein [Agrobacterium tumefaciens]WIE41141.1 hypothetical protein G6L16_023415 [Agrobacterium tumefaciens]